MNSIRNRTLMVVAIVVGMVAIDQSIKMAIHNHFYLGESKEIFSWFWLCYVENPGMAFGIEWFDKLALTLFRIVVVGLLGWYLHRLIRKPEVRTSYIGVLALIVAGALGNIIDCVFYGPLFGNAPWLYGKVIDMFYFPLIHNSAGEVIFFQPVFNWADSCIVCAVAAILIWFRKEVSAEV